MVALMGCPKPTVLRSAEVYRAELEQYNQWATQQAGLLRAFVGEHCACSDEGTFNEPECTKAADWLLTVEYRAEWHKQMSLYNASQIEERPSETPPEIPASSCPLVPPPGEEAVPSDEERIDAEEEAAETTEPEAEAAPAPEATEE